MYLNDKSEYEKIWKILNNIRSGLVIDGKTVYCTNEKVKVPSYAEIFKRAISNLNEMGFSVERVEPKKANCILRVFCDENLAYDKELYWMYGTETYLKTIDGMLSEHKILIDYSEFRVQFWFFQDESTIFEPDFVDYYLKIKRRKDRKQSEQ